MESSDDECVGKLAGRLGSLSDAVEDARGQTDRGWVDAATNKALDAQKVLSTRCGKRNISKWSRPLNRVVARLQSASRSL